MSAQDPVHKNSNSPDLFLTLLPSAVGFFYSHTWAAAHQSVSWWRPRSEVPEQCSHSGTTVQSKGAWLRTLGWFLVIFLQISFQTLVRCGFSFFYIFKCQAYSTENTDFTRCWQTGGPWSICHFNWTLNTFYAHLMVHITVYSWGFTCQQTHRLLERASRVLLLLASRRHIWTSKHPNNAPAEKLTRNPAHNVKAANVSSWPHLLSFFMSKVVRVRVWT